MESFTKRELQSIARQNNIIVGTKSKEELYSCIEKVCTLGYHTDIDHATINNSRFRKLLFTSPEDGVQLVLMSIPVGGEIGEEVHPKTTQFIRVENGIGHATVGCQTFSLKTGSAIVIPMGIAHNVVNTSKTRPLKLYTVYSNSLH